MSAQILRWKGVTTLDLPPAQVLERAAEADLESVFVLGFDKDGDPFFSSSTADGGTLLWLIEIVKARLMGIAGEPK
jgi:hypothetical protein